MYSKHNWIRLSAGLNNQGNSRRVWIQVIDGFVYVVDEEPETPCTTIKTTPSEIRYFKKVAEGQRKDGIEATNHENWKKRP